ncbi:MAG: Lrp/AsnC family transcriptional regulator [Desulfurococcales archaeon]|nr:Lrp/AsnC family transcriptional regulator [Desulfurococcales archaeon]
MDRASLDSKDLRLLDILKLDGRAPYSRLAAELNISESAVRKRIARLKKLGIIKRFTVEYEIPGEATAIILVKTQPPTPTPEVSRAIIRYRHVDKVYEITGEYDILVVVRASSILDINNIIDYIRSIKGVVGTQTSIVLRSY